MMRSINAFNRILDDDSIRKLTALGIEKLSDFIDELSSEPDSANLGFKEKIEILINRLYQHKINNTIMRLKQDAKLSEPEANIVSIIYDKERGLNRQTIIDLASCDYMNNKLNIVLYGPTGSGKTYVACALANAAIERCFKVKYVRMPDLVQEYEDRIAMGRTQTTLIKKYARPSLLIIDEWLIYEITPKFCNLLLEIAENRKNSSTVFCTLNEQSSWHALLGGSVQAESIIDRIVHRSINIMVGPLNMREYTSPVKIFNK